MARGVPGLAVSLRAVDAMRYARRIALALGMLISATPWMDPAAADVAGCPVFPANNVWNVPIDSLPVHPRSAAFIDSLGATAGLHPDFGSGLWNGGPIGIPFTSVPRTQPRVLVTFDYADESDPGPYPIRPNPPIEGGPASTGDRHVIVVRKERCKLFEMWNAAPQPLGLRAAAT